MSNSGTPLSSLYNSTYAELVGEHALKNDAKNEVKKRKLTETFFSPSKPKEHIPKMVDCLIEIHAGLEVLFEMQRELARVLAENQKEIKILSSRIDALSSAPISPSPTALTTAVKTAIRSTRAEEDSKITRRGQVFLRNLKEETPKSDQDALRDLCTLLGVSPPQKSFRIRTRLPSLSSTSTAPLVLTFSTAKEASLFTRSLNTKKRDSTQLASVYARPNYTKEEETLYKDLWREAIERNDTAGKKVAIVRDLVLVTLKTPGEWTVKTRGATPSS